MHSALNCKFGQKYQTLSTEKLAQLKETFRHLKIIILDEMSMVSSNHLYDIHKRLTTIFQNQEIFGGKAVLLLGDLMQLKPVRGPTIYSEPTDKENQRQALWSSNYNIWSNLDVVCLTTNYRQGEGTAWLKTLNRTRIAENFDDLEEEDKELLQSKFIKKEMNWKLKEDTTHLYYTNNEVEEHNTLLLNRLKTPICEVEASVDKNKGYKHHITSYGTIDNTAFLFKVRLKIGARVMLVYNVNTSDSLVNGSLGTVIDIIFHESKKEVNSIIVKFDNDKVGEEQRNAYNSIAAPYSEDNGTPIFQIELDYQPARKNSMKTHANNVKITQFPLRLAWASTVHKYQGVTIPEGKELVCHGHKRMPKGMAYVMLSRAASHENVHFSKSFDLEKIQADPSSLEEKKSLDARSLDFVTPRKEETFDIFFVNIANLSHHYHHLKNDPVVKKSKLVCLVETWLPVHKCDEKKNLRCGCFNEFQISGFSLLHSASVGNGKGCCLYSQFSEVQNLTLKHKSHNENFQLISILLKKEKVQLTIIYLSSHARRIDLESLTMKLTTYLDSNHKQIILGDFNFHRGENNVLSRFFTQNGLHQLVTRPTRISGRTIDHIYCSDETLNHSLRSIYYSDHCSIRINLT